MFMHDSIYVHAYNYACHHTHMFTVTTPICSCMSPHPTMHTTMHLFMHISTQCCLHNYNQFHACLNTYIFMPHPSFILTSIWNCFCCDCSGFLSFSGALLAVWFCLPLGSSLAVGASPCGPGLFCWRFCFPSCPSSPLVPLLLLSDPALSGWCWPGALLIHRRRPLSTYKQAWSMHMYEPSASAQDAQAE